MNKTRLLSLLVILLLCSSVYSSDNKWDVRIESSKQVYMLHEPIVLDVTVTNSTSDTLRTHGLMQPNNSELSVFLKDGNGKQVEYSGPRFLQTSEPGRLLLEPNDHDYNCFNILELYGARECKSGYEVSCSRFPYLPEGTYTVAAEYEGDISNELSINVVAPYGQEAEVLKKIEEAYQIWSQSDTDPSSRVYGEIPRDYPNSVYTELCYYLSRFYSHEIFNGFRSGAFNLRTLNREMLAKYPNSANVKGWLLSLTDQKNEDEKTAIYDKLINEHPNTRCSKMAGLLKKRILAKREVRK